MPACIDTEETERHPSEFQGLLHTRCCSPFAHPSFLNLPVNMDYFHVKKKKILQKDMKLTQKQVGQVAERLYQASQGCTGLQDRWAKLPGWGGRCVEGGQGVGSGVGPQP